MVNLARDMLADAIIGGVAYPKFNESNTHIGIGDSTTPFAATQTDLVAVTNKFYKQMITGFPQRANNVIMFRALFGNSDANFVWNEWGIFNGNPGDMLSRKVEALGTKTALTTRQVTATITIVGV